MSRNEGRGKYLAKNTVLLALGNFGSKIISFFLVPLYTGTLLTNEYGIVDLISTIATVLAPILTLNLAEAVMRFALDNEADLKQILRIGMIGMFILVFGGLLIFPFSHLSSQLTDYSWYIYFYVLSLGFCQFFQMYLRGEEKLLKYAISCLLQSVSVAILNIVFLLILKMRLEGYFLAYIISFSITALYAILQSGTVTTLFENGKEKLNKSLAMSMIKYSVVLIPNSFMWWIMNSSDRIMVTSMLGASVNGIYAISYKIPTLLSTMSSIFCQAWMFSAIKEEKSESRDEYSNQVLEAYVSILLVIAAGLMIILKPFMRLYVSPSYYTAWAYTPYLLVGFVFMSIGSFFATQYTVHKDSKGFLFSGMSGAIINIMLNFILIPLIGATGAAIATCIGYLTVFLYRLVDTRKYIKYKYQKKYLFGLLLIICSVIVSEASVGVLEYLALPIVFILEITIFKNIWSNAIHGILMKLYTTKGRQ